MTAEQFAYWLQGFMEVANPTTLDETQTQQIKDHLNLVFDKQTPDRNTPPTNPFPIWQQPHTVDPTNPMTPDWTWRPNPYTITCTDNIQMNDPNKKYC